MTSSRPALTSLIFSYSHIFILFLFDSFCPPHSSVSDRDSSSMVVVVDNLLSLFS